MNNRLLLLFLILVLTLLAFTHRGETGDIPERLPKEVSRLKPEAP